MSDNNAILHQCTLGVTSDVLAVDVPEPWMRLWDVSAGKVLDVAPEGCVRMILHIPTPHA